MLGNAHRERDFTLRQALDLAQLEDAAASLRQVSDQPPHAGELMPAGGDAFGRRFFGEPCERIQFGDCLDAHHPCAAHTLKHQHACGREQIRPA